MPGWLCGDSRERKGEREKNQGAGEKTPHASRGCFGEGALREYSLSLSSAFPMVAGCRVVRAQRLCLEQNLGLD